MGKKPNYFVWHYTVFLPRVVHRIKDVFGLTIHVCSLPQLLKTLLYPWKRAYRAKQHPGLNLQDLFDRFTFNTISRIIGCTLRSVVIIFGIVLILFVAFFGTIVYLVSFFALGFSYIYYVQAHKPTETDKLLLLDNDQEVLHKLFQTEFGQFVLYRCGIHVDETHDCIEKTR